MIMKKNASFSGKSSTKIIQGNKVTNKHSER